MNSARILSKDNAVSNGIVHIIDEVLWPPENLLVDKIQDPQLQYVSHTLLMFIIHLSQQHTYTSIKY